MKIAFRGMNEEKKEIRLPDISSSRFLSTLGIFLMLFKKFTIYNFLSLKYKIKPVYLEESREKNCTVWEIAFEMGK